MSSYNKKDIKNMSSDFRVVANRLLNSEYDTMDNNLKRFVHYIKTTPLINNYLQPLKEKYSSFDIEKDISQVQYNGGLTEFIDSEEEVSYSYQVLLYIVENNVSYRRYVMGYSTSNNFSDMVKSFNNKFILPFVNNIDRYFERICVEMGMDETTNYYINNNDNVQLNIAKDNATITAIQNNYSEIDKLVEKIKDKVNVIDNSEIQEEIIDNIEGIQEEVKKGTVKKGRIKSFVTSLQGIIPKIGFAVEVSAAITELITFAQQFIK